MKTPPEGWILTRVVVDQSTIAGDDVHAIILPVWFASDFYQTYDMLEESLAQFSWPQRLVWSVMWFEQEVGNGGLDQFFWNSTGMIWPEALEGLSAIGREDLAAIVESAAGCFPELPSRERAERQAVLDGDQLAIEFGDLAERYFRLNADVESRLLQYIRTQPEAFLFEGDLYLPPPRSPHSGIQ